MKHLFYTAGIIIASSFGSSMNAQTMILEENFDSGIPASFLMYNNDGYTPHADVSEYSDAWIAKEDPDDASNTVASATSYFDQPGMANRWLITPSLTLGTFGNHLSWTGKSHDASYAESYLVLLSTTGTAVEDFTDTLQAVINEDIYWTHHAIDLSEKGYDGETVHIAFVLRTIDGFKLYMDSLKVTKEDPVGIEQTTPATAFQLFPNPATEKITFQSEFTVQQAVIRDVNGVVVLETTDKEMDVRNLSAGIYFLELTHSEGISAQRFIKR